MHKLSPIIQYLLINLSELDVLQVPITTKTVDRETGNTLIESKTNFSELLEAFCTPYLSHNAPIDQINQVYDTLVLMKQQIDEKIKLVEDIHSSISPEEPYDVVVELPEANSTFLDTSKVQNFMKDFSEYIVQTSENSYLINTYQEGEDVYLPLPERVLQGLQLKEGDELSFIQENDGSIVLKRKH